LSIDGYVNVINTMCAPSVLTNSLQSPLLEALERADLREESCLFVTPSLAPPAITRLGLRRRFNDAVAESVVCSSSSMLFDVDVWCSDVRSAASFPLCGQTLETILGSINW
jgi:hypothetical protein